MEPRNCHPFHTDRGYIAHKYETGPHASDSRNMVDAWIRSGYDNTVFDGQGHVVLITPHGCLKWLEGEPVEHSHGVWVLEHPINFPACRKARPDIINKPKKRGSIMNSSKYFRNRVETLTEKRRNNDGR